MKNILFAFLIIGIVIVSGCGTNSCQTWARSMVPQEFVLNKVSDDEYQFIGLDVSNAFELDHNWNDGKSIHAGSYIGGDCIRGFKGGQNVNYFYCTGSFNYFDKKQIIDEEGNIKEGVNQFGITNLVLRETNTPNVFEMVEYEISTTYPYKCKKGF
ncbi:MAG: hypothetical protein ABH849_02630 [Nanoarchaeota archaeon]